MTLPSRSQGRRLAKDAARVPAPKIQKQTLTCLNSHRAGDSTVTNRPGGPRCWDSSTVANECPVCAKQPTEPVTVDGQFACLSCTEPCAVCGHAVLPGDITCTSCVRELGLAQAVGL